MRIMISNILKNELKLIISIRRDKFIFGTLKGAPRWKFAAHQGVRL